MNPIFVAIDTPDLTRAMVLASQVREHAGGLKLGLEFFIANGPAGVRELASAGLPVFLDLKLHDIPNTVAKAVEAVGPLKPAILTVHAAGGRTMLEAAKAAAPAETKVVAVTVLTSLDAADLAETGVNGSPTEQVQRLAELARNSGIDGIVCSGAEVAAARSDLARRLLRRARRASGRCGHRRPEARRHAASGAGRRRVGAGDRPSHYRGRRPRPRHPRDRCYPIQI